MATLARAEFDALDENGNLIVDVSVEVRNEATNALASLYSDRAGATAIGNPVTFADGRVVFHVEGGAYKITLYDGTDCRDLRYVAIGTAAETDASSSGRAIMNADSYAAIRLLLAGAPVTKTADFTVADTDQYLINNKSGSSCTVTLPAASSWSGRPLHFKNLQAQTVVSASSNVVPRAGGLAGTAILASGAGAWCTMVSDGTNWVIMAGS